MIDLAASGSLFVNVFGASKEWAERKVIRIEPLDSVLEEPAVAELKKQGHAIEWRGELELRRLRRDGWKPVIERDGIGRPSIFMDRLEELVLVHRPPKKEAE